MVLTRGGSRHEKNLAVPVERAVYGPCRERKAVHSCPGRQRKRFLHPLAEGLILSNAGNTNRSAKDLFFPQVENLVGFRVSGKEIRMIETRDRRFSVLFGVRACDGRSFELLDRVFLADAKDTYYETRRQSATVVTLACSPGRRLPVSAEISASTRRNPAGMCPAGWKGSSSTGRPTRKRVKP